MRWWRQQFHEFTGGKGMQYSWLLAWFILFTLLASACQSNTVDNSDRDLDGSTTPAIGSTVPPPLISTVVGPQSQQAFSPLSSDELSATVTVIIGQPEQNQSEAANNDEFDVIPSTSSPPASPRPTFTAPALPQTQSWDHYWLRRPIPEGGTVWTDKAYPYGSDRGGTLRTHHGVEFNVIRGTPILAAASGTVIVAGDDQQSELGAAPNFYGNVVVIEHDTGLDGQAVYSLYGHLSDIYISVGQRVLAQDLIASSGASGVADGPHLHFEVRVGENSYSATRNPLLWLYPFPDRGVVAGQISNSAGQAIPNAPLSLRRIDAPSAYAETTSYADSSVNSDGKWQENFVFDDIVAGYYELTVGEGDDKIKLEFWVYPYQTNIIEVNNDG